MDAVAKPLVYLITGMAGSGRRELLADVISEARGNSDAGETRPLVLLADTERADPADEKLTTLASVHRWQWLERGGGPEGLDGRIETEPLAVLLFEKHADNQKKLKDVKSGTGAFAPVFFVTDGRRNPVDQIEAVKPWLAESGGELARVICVVHCKHAADHRELVAWHEACIHFSDVVLLARREGVQNKWLSDFQARFKDKFYPCLFDFVKDGGVKNPALVLQPEARRMSHYFDETEYQLVDGGDIESDEDDDADAPGKRQNDEEIEVVAEVDEYLARRAGGRRVKEIPDVSRFLE